MPKIAEARARALERICKAMVAEAAPRNVLWIEEVPSNDGCGVDVTVKVDGYEPRRFYFANHELDKIGDDGYLVRLCRPARYGLSIDG